MSLIHCHTVNQNHVCATRNVRNSHDTKYFKQRNGPRTQLANERKLCPKIEQSISNAIHIVNKRHRTFAPENARITIRNSIVSIVTLRTARHATHASAQSMQQLLATPTKYFMTKFSKFPKKYFYIFLATPTKILDQIFEISQKVFLHIFGHAPKFSTKFSKYFPKNIFTYFLATPTKNFWPNFRNFPKSIFTCF